MRARRMRALLTAAGIVLGVGLMLGVLLLTATINSTFRDLFDSIYGEADIVLSPEADSGTLKRQDLKRVKEVEGVEIAQGDLQDVFVRVKGSARQAPQAVPGAGATGETPPTQTAPGQATPGQAAPGGEEPGQTPGGTASGQTAPTGQGAAPDQAPPAAEPAEDTAEINVSSVDPRKPDTAGLDFTAGRKARGGREIELERNWAEDQKLEPGDRVRLGTPTGTTAFEVAGLFNFARTFGFGGEGFGRIPLKTARRVMDRPRGFDEITVVADDALAVESVQGDVRDVVRKGVEVTTPEGRSDDVQAQLQGLTVLLLFVAAMALFVGAFLIFNAFQVTVLQRQREIGLLRTIGASRGAITRGLLREAAVLGIVGTALGVALGIALARGLVWLMGEIGFPVGGLSLAPAAVVVACAAGVVVTLLGALYPAWRAGRTAPLRAVLGIAEARRAPSPFRAAIGLAMAGIGLVGVFILASADDVPTGVAAAGMLGVVLIFLGVSFAAPFAIVPIVRVLSWPLRRIAPIQGRLASDSAKSNPGRTALTATGLMIGLALVTAFGALSSSFLGSVTSEFDEAFARDFTIQPSGFSPGQGPQQTISPKLRKRVARLPDADVVTPQRIFYSDRLLADEDGLALAFDPVEFGAVDDSEFAGGLSEAEVLPKVGDGQITVGDTFAKEQKLGVGDRVRIRGPSGERRAKIAGVVKTVIFGGQTLGMSLETMRKVYGVTRDSNIAVTARSPEARPALEREMERIVKKDFPQLQVLSNDELKGEIESQVNAQFGFFNALLFVAVLVSLFGVINTLSMNVLERTREIGVLRALGSSRWQVRLTIGQEGLLLCAVGAVFGIAVGLALGYVFVRGIATAVPSVSYVAPLGTVVVVAAVGVLLGLLASILPARRAARMNVIRALSYE